MALPFVTKDDRVVKIWMFCVCVFMCQNYIQCQGDNDGDVRLVDGPTANEGRVEIFNQSQWGTVCDDSWDDTDALVVCRQLGYSHGLAQVGGTYGQGTGPIFLDDVMCNGDEASLGACENSGWGNNDCNHKEDAGVICLDDTEGDVRLVDGSAPSQGRVEIYHDGSWGTVCNDHWDHSNARVVCRQLRYPGYVGLVITGTFGPGSGPIHLDDVDCVGDESRLAACMSNAWGVNNCAHAEDAGVSCEDGIEGAVQLVNGVTEDEGQVQIFHDGQWARVCADAWSDIEATVVCRQLGYPDHLGKAISTGFGLPAGTIYLDDVKCTRSEYRLIDCRHNGWGGLNGSTSCNVGVSCADDGEGDIQLVDHDFTVGDYRVRMQHESVWRSVCSHSWDDTEAIVVCRQQGYPANAGRATFRDTYGYSDDLLTDVSCMGNESRLTYCSNNGLDQCAYREVARVSCSENHEGDVHLIEGATRRQGRVKIYHNNQWGTVCSDGWDDADARVVCRQLGYLDGVGTAINGSTDGRGSGPIHLDNVACTGNEARLDACSSNGWGIDNCSHTQDAGVSCDHGYRGEIRLVGGSSPYEGRVEIYYEGEWGTVCDDNWNDNDARVVCRQLGYSTNDSRALSSAAFGSGSGPIHLDEIACQGDEAMLADCGFYHSSGWGYSDCDHNEDAGVICQKIITDGNVRLVGALIPNQGRVEIYHNSRWGTVCDESWDDLDASVVCRQLGYSSNISIALTLDMVSYGRGSGPIYLSNVTCEGNESRLADCAHSGWGSNDCSHGQDAGVHCHSNSTRISVRVVDTMSFVGLSLSILTLVAIITVRLTCRQSKASIADQGIPLSTLGASLVAFPAALIKTTHNPTHDSNGRSSLAASNVPVELPSPRGRSTSSRKVPTAPALDEEPPLAGILNDVIGSERANVAVSKC